MKLSIVELVDYITMPDASLCKDFQGADKRGDEVWLTDIVVVPWASVRRAVVEPVAEAPTVRKAKR